MGGVAFKMELWVRRGGDDLRKVRQQSDEGIGAVFGARAVRVEQGLTEVAYYDGLEEVFLDFVATEN